MNRDHDGISLIVHINTKLLISRDIAVEYEVVTKKASPTGGAGVVLLPRQLDCRGGKGFVIFGIGYV